MFGARPSDRTRPLQNPTLVFGALDQRVETPRRHEGNRSGFVSVLDSFSMCAFVSVSYGAPAEIVAPYIASCLIVL